MAVRMFLGGWIFDGDFSHTEKEVTTAGEEKNERASSL